MEEFDSRFEIILYAGNAESGAMMAMEAARERNFEEARAKIAYVTEELHKAHQIQTNLLHENASGKELKMDILMVHAQDHLTMGSLLKDIASEIISLSERVSELEEKIK